MWMPCFGTDSNPVSCLCATHCRFVQEVTSDHLWVAVSACERGMLVAAESSDDPTEIADFDTRFQEGQSLTCTVCEVC